jgi:hypothetical protein
LSGQDVELQVTKPISFDLDVQKHVGVGVTEAGQGVVQGRNSGVIGLFPVEGVVGWRVGARVRVEVLAG